MTDFRTCVIVGASLAGAKAAQTLRADGFDGRIVLVGAENDPPYERPPLSKGYLRGEADAKEAVVHPVGFYAQHGIELRTGARVVSVDRSRRRAVLATGEPIGYDRLLLATGAEPRRLRAPGSDLRGIVYLRDRVDADRIRAALARAKSVVVVGGGWIGAEVAASARQLGCDVTMVHPQPAPLHGVLGPQVAAVYRSLHADRGVGMCMNTRVEAFRGTAAVEEVVTQKGVAIAADVVVVGVGAVPRTELASEAGLRVDKGVVVDEYLRTRDDGIFAAGDVAAAWHPVFGGRVRIQHWDNALHQGPAAARSMLGAAEPYDRLPYFFSDQYDMGMEYVGHAPVWDRVVFRGDPLTRAFIAFWIKDDHVVAAANVNVWGVIEDLRDLISSRHHVDDRRLRDPDVPLDSLVPHLVAGR